MAGFGSRFSDAGYAVPKYEIVVHGRTLFEWSLLSLKQFLDDGSNVVFIVRKAQNAVAFIDSECLRMGLSKYRVVELDSPTDGQATTALMAGSALTDPESPFLVYNIDTFVYPAVLNPSDVKGQGWVPCFAGLGDHWSFAKLGPSGNVIELAEKRRISNHATVGLYYFESFSMFEKLYNRFFDGLESDALPEKYIAPMYNGIINDGMEVFIQELPYNSVHCLGTPAEVKVFEELDSHLVYEAIERLQG